MKFIFTFLLLFQSAGILAQSPHGKDFDLDCSDCHTSESWTPLSSKMKFDHNSTGFKLVGLHKTVVCNSCHENLVFSGAGERCSDCHYDVHNATTSYFCEKCHSPEMWLVTDLQLMHQNGRFPLVGLHNAVPCADCHVNYDKYEFDIIGVKCFDCHSENYYSTTNPNHASSGFDTNCETCHNLANDWSFYHDGLFPIYSGSHAGTWSNCSECHTAEPNYLVFSCIDCHEHSQSAMDAKHRGEVSGYVYESNACFRCHPTGIGEGD